MGTELKEGDRVRLLPLEGSVTYVTISGTAADIMLDTNVSITVRSASVVEKVLPPKPPVGSVVQFEGTKRVFVVHEGDKISRIWPDGEVMDGYSWNNQSDNGKNPFKVATFN